MQIKTLNKIAACGLERFGAAYTCLLYTSRCV